MELIFQYAQDISAAEESFRTAIESDPGAGIVPVRVISSRLGIVAWSDYPANIHPACLELEDAYARALQALVDGQPED
jgi:hypothetical protein